MILERLSLKIAFERDGFAQSAFTRSRQQGCYRARAVSAVASVGWSAEPPRDSDVR